MIYGEMAKILAVKQLDARHVRMSLGAPLIAGAVKPGQFVNIICGESKFGSRVYETPEEFVEHKNCPGMEDYWGRRLLRRPFAVAKVHVEGKEPRSIDILFKVVGKGSAALAEMEEGEVVDVLGPLGKGFDLARADEAH